MKIWHISDTHENHNQLIIPPDVDMIIHSGDESNSPNIQNIQECRSFLEWYSQLPIKYKILVAGNHSTAIANKWITRNEIEAYGIIYLEHEYTEIEGIKIFGSPYTPTFGNWSFMKSRQTINRLWDTVTEQVDILVLHGPPKGILDLSYDRDGKLEKCGDNSLYKLIKRIQPRLVCFGHIHDNEDNYNQGQVLRDGVMYSNGSCVTDGKMGKISSNGNIFNLKYLKK